MTSQTVTSNVVTLSKQFQQFLDSCNLTNVLIFDNVNERWNQLLYEFSKKLIQAIDNKKHNKPNSNQRFNNIIKPNAQLPMYLLSSPTVMSSNSPNDHSLLPSNTCSPNFLQTELPKTKTVKKSTVVKQHSLSNFFTKK